MPYDKEHNLTSLPESSSGSILVRWDSYKDCDWEGVEVIRRAFNQRIAPETKVMLL
mgnify:CR=1 FL=1